jgi:hypothetical protein
MFCLMRRRIQSLASSEPQLHLMILDPTMALRVLIFVNHGRAPRNNRNANANDRHSGESPNNVSLCTTMT